MSKKRKNDKIEKENKRNFDSALWFKFAYTTVLVMAITTFVVSFVAVILYRYGFLPQQRGTPMPTILIVVSGMVAGLVLALYIGSHFLRPMDEINKAMQKVASGDFTVRVSEDHKNDSISEMSKSFNTMVTELSGTETLRSDFIANVSHEFKTPLSAIEGYTMLLQNPNLTEEKRLEYSDKVLANTKRLSELTGNILKLSKLENQDVITDKKTFNLDEQIRQVIVDLESRWAEKEIEFDIELEEVSYNSNESLLYQVWYNLIANAIKFSPKNSVIKVSLIKTDGYLLANVSDNGIGISEEDKAHVFEKFYQADRAHSLEGNGLGLALVKKIVTLHKGEVLLESELNIGSTFTIKLPL